MDGIYIWEERTEASRWLLKGYLKEEPLAWLARIVDSSGSERWSERFASRDRARAGLVSRVPEDARFLKGAPIPD